MTLNMRVVSLIYLVALLDVVCGIHVGFISSVVYRNDLKVQNAIAQGLIDNGDNVTLVAPISYTAYSKLGFPKATNFFSLERLADRQSEVLSENYNETFYQVMNWVSTSCSQFYSEPYIERLLQQGDLLFDIVIVDARYNECVLPILRQTDTTFIFLATTNRIPTYVKYALAIPDHPSYSPDQWSLNDRLIFTKRMKAYFNYRKLLNVMHYWYYRTLDSHIATHIASHKNLLTSIQSMAFILQDTNLAIDIPLPTFNNIIPIGGIECTEGDPDNLAPEIREFIEGTKWGTIYASFGTVFKTSNLQYSSLLKLVTVFGRVKQRVLWVFDDADVIQLSSNVMAVRSINQQDVLAHPNVVLFVSHMGHFSRQEAIYHSVPIIGFPLFDPLQFANADYIHGKKIGLKFDINAFSEEMLLNGIMEVITNPKFNANIRVLSQQMRDTLISPVQAAVYWINYAVRSKGAPHLRSHSMNLYWFQYYLVDVVIFVTVSTLLVLYVLVGIVKWCRSRYLLHLQQEAEKHQSKRADTKKLINSLKEE